MATINKTNTTKNAVELRKALAKNGTTIEPLIVNGVKIGMFGFTSDDDRKKAIEAFQEAIDASDGDTYKMMTNIGIIAKMSEKGIDGDDDEMVTINGRNVIVSYEAKTAYDTNGEEIANCTDLPNMPNEAIKAVLMARVEAELAKHYCDCDCDYCCDDCLGCENDMY